MNSKEFQFFKYRLAKITYLSPVTDRLCLHLPSQHVNATMCI